MELEDKKNLPVGIVPLGKEVLLAQYEERLDELEKAKAEIMALMQEALQ